MTVQGYWAVSAVDTEPSDGWHITDVVWNDVRLVNDGAISWAPWFHLSQFVLLPEALIGKYMSD